VPMACAIPLGILHQSPLACVCVVSDSSLPATDLESAVRYLSGSGAVYQLPKGLCAFSVWTMTFTGTFVLLIFCKDAAKSTEMTENCPTE